MTQPLNQPLPTTGIPVNITPCGPKKTYSKRHLTELLIKRARDIKMLPATATKAISLADDPETTIHELADVIAQDAKLTTNILSLANSPVFPVYASGQKISSLAAAVTRLGFRQTKQMILVSCYSSMVQSMDWNEIAIREKLAKHSFLTAVLCRDINRLLNLEIQGEEFTAGLLHDVGRILLAITVPNEFSSFDPMDFDESGTTLEVEKTIVGTNHAEIGAWFLSRNQLTDDLISVARYHHNPLAASRYNRLVALVALADSLANHYHQFELEGEFSCDDLEATQLLGMLGVGNCAEVINAVWLELLEGAIATMDGISTC